MTDYFNRFVQRPPQNGGESSSDERFKDLDIRYPVCSKFVAKSKDSKICHCNQRLKDHKRDMRQGTRKSQLGTLENEKWERKIHTKSERVAALGRLINGSLYARLDDETEMEMVERLLFEVWKFPTPKLVISIIGGADHFTLDDRLETHFINGIVNVAIRSDIWLITSGYNNALVQLVGQAIIKAKIRRSQHQLIALAICKWGNIKNPYKLIRPKKNEFIQQTKTDASDSSDDDDDDDDDHEVEAQKNKKLNLDMNHTHYLMLDDAKYRNVSTEDYRTRLCSHVSELHRENDFNTPIVTLVVEGGNATISNIYHDLKANIPVVIINDTGRVADFFSRWLMFTKDFNKKSGDSAIVYGIEELKTNSEVNPVRTSKASVRSNGRKDIKLTLHEVSIDLSTKKLPDLFSRYEKQLKQDLKQVLAYNDDLNTANPVDQKTQQKSSTDDITVLCEQVMYCLQPSVRSNIAVFNLNSENDLSETMFQSISRSYEKIQKRKQKEADERKQKKADERTNNVQSDSKEDGNIEQDPLLELAMDWDCIDVAQEFVFKNSLQHIRNTKKAFIDALKNNLFTFVYEFLKLGFDPATIFFSGKTFFEETFRHDHFINELYDKNVVFHDSNHLKSFVDADPKFIKKEIASTDALNVILRTLVGDYMYKLYFNSSKGEAKSRTESGLTSEPKAKASQRSVELEETDRSTLEEKRKTAHDYIMRDLFIWAILMNYMDMAKVILSHMKYRICPALIATKILKQYHHKAPYGELREGYEKGAQYFEDYAVTCLDKCDDHDAAKACEIILQRNELYGYVTCVQVAADAEDKKFLATQCCVEAMNNIWYDKLYPDQTSKLDQLSLIFGFLSLGVSAPPTVTYRQSEGAETGETLEKTLRLCGINYSDPYPLEYPRRLKSAPEINRYTLKLKHFHQSLLMKFCYHLVTYCFFLLLFSYVLLFNFSPPTDQIPSIHWTEILTIMLVSCMFIEEVHYFLTQDSLTFGGKLSNYCRDLFKPMTMIAFVLFYIGLIVRFTHGNSEDDFIAARVIMAIDIELWWLRSLSFIIVIPILGPHLVAITKMLKDLSFFVCIIVIVMAGYGVASRSMVYYPVENNFTTATGGPIDTSFDGRSVFRQIAYPVYFFLHGDFSDELTNLDSNPDAGWSIATHVLLAIHMLFVNILLTNLLIAMFSKRFDEVYDDAKNIWHSQQYLFTREYFTRAPFFPPISLGYDMYHLCRMFIFFIRRKADRHANVFKMIPVDKKRIRKWYDFEGAATYEYAHAEVKAAKAAAKSSSEEDSSNAENTADVMNRQKEFDDVLENLKQVQVDVTRLNSSIGGMQEELSKRFKSESKD